ncbi:hypothetical protein LC593_33310 [Nostoc sp. CHAB 5844]|nr:hypothetical protein [Nostoc sp. CHAB 5844]
MKKQPKILEQWQSYEKAVMPKNALSVQRQETRRAFYAGVTAMISIMHQLADDDFGDEEAANALERIEQECKAFVARVGIDY